MSIVTLWSCDKKTNGQTLSSVAIATKMAIERNLKILLVSTSVNDLTIKRCFWKTNISKGNMMRGNGGLEVETGIEGLIRLVYSNKLEPSIITDYAQAILKGRFEVLFGFNGASDNFSNPNMELYSDVYQNYCKILQVANQYYDMVIVDLDGRLNLEMKNKILDISDMNIYITTQKVSDIERYIDLKQNNKNLNTYKSTVAIAKYDDESKYNKKNLAKYLEEKGEVLVIPYNTLYFEAAEEADVMDLFLKLSNIKDTTDKNYIFMKEVQRIVNFIMNRLQELQMRMG